MTAAELSRELGVSQATISRAIAASTGILRIGETRGARYAWSQELHKGDSRWNLYIIDEKGRPSTAGVLHSLSKGEFFLDSDFGGDNFAYLLTGDPHPRLFPDLPWFLDDMRPQGYLGRLLAQVHGPSLGIGTNPEHWSIGESLRAILEFGSDTPGNFVLGGKAIDQFLNPEESRKFIDEPDIVESYDLIARNISEGGEPPGSSAGGEQPKFTACVRRSQDLYTHVIVKFSGSRQTDAGRRWAALLRAESIASEELDRIGLPVSRARLLDTDNRVYLEVERFDRVGRRGRKGVLTLRAILAGQGERLDRTWTKSIQPLIKRQWLSEGDANRIATLEHFGQLIGNTDMHPGNLGLYLEPQLPLRLCPSYDMLPMAYAPSRFGDLPELPIQRKIPRPEEVPSWRPAAEAALRFWQRLAGETIADPGFSSIAARNREIVDSVLQSS